MIGVRTLGYFIRVRNPKENFYAFCVGQVTRKSTRSSETDRKLHVRKLAENLDAAAQETILVVDDDPSVLRALARLIHSSSYRVRIFDRPSAVRSADIPRKNACLLADIYLPEMNGIEMCESLAKSGHPLPAILMTARNDAATQRLINRANARAVLFKPFDKKSLLEAIALGMASSNEVGRDVH